MRNISLIAISKTTGDALISWGGATYLLMPPYHKSDARRVFVEVSGYITKAKLMRTWQDLQSYCILNQILSAGISIGAQLRRVMGNAKFSKDELVSSITSHCLNDKIMDKRSLYVIIKSLHVLNLMTFKEAESMLAHYEIQTPLRAVNSSLYDIRTNFSSILNSIKCYGEMTTGVLEDNQRIVFCISMIYPDLRDSLASVHEDISKRLRVIYGKAASESRKPWQQAYAARIKKYIK